MALNIDYLKSLGNRSRKSRVYQKYQFTGLHLADILGDQTHKALYIRLAKQYGEFPLLSFAKRVAERKDIRNKGAYFMKLLSDPVLARSKKILPARLKIKKTVQKSLFPALNRKKKNNKNG